MMVLTVSLVTALAGAHAVLGLQLGSLLQKRADSSSSQRVDIPLTFDPRGRAVTMVTMSPGNGQQVFNFTMSTSTGLTYVAGTQCSSCSGALLYNQTESTTAQPFSSADIVPVFGEPAGASIIKESCQLTQQNGSAWAYPNQTIVVLNQQTDSPLELDSNAQIGNGLSGLIGIGTNRGSPGNSSGFSANFDDSIMGQFFIRNPDASNFTFGIMLNTPLTSPRGNSTSSSTPVTGAGGAAGVLHWLQPDPSAYDASKLSWVTASTNASASIPTVNSNSTGSGDWLVGLDGIIVNAGGQRISTSESIVATVDPLYFEMYLPTSEARVIHDAIPNSALRADLSSLGPLSQAWSIPCDTEFSFGIIADSQVFTMNQNTLVLQLPDGTCVSAIEGWTDTTVTTYLFGSRFVSTIYLIFNIPKDGSNQMGIAPRSTPSSPSSHIGPIVGGVVGGAAFLVIVGLVAFWWFRYRHRAGAHRVTAALYDHDNMLEKPSDGDVQPYTLVSPTNVPLMHGPTSSVGSGQSPVGSNFSQFGVSTTGAMIAMNGDEQILDVAPPSYEQVSEGNPSPHSPEFTTTEKAEYHPTESPRWQPSSLYPVEENGPGTSGSNTLLA